jgi:hypothetical protein
MCNLLKIKNLSLLPLLLLLANPAMVQAQFTFITNNGAITITGYNTAAGLSVVIPAATNGYPVTRIGDEAFWLCNLTNLTIPDSVITIGRYSFYDCTSLSSVIIGNSVTNIVEGAFQNCAMLTSVTIGNSVKIIGDEAFGSCTSLTNITVNTANAAYSSSGGVLFDNARATLIQFPTGWGVATRFPTLSPILEIMRSRIAPA